MELTGHSRPLRPGTALPFPPPISHQSPEPHLSSKEPTVLPGGGGSGLLSTQPWEGGGYFPSGPQFPHCPSLGASSAKNTTTSDPAPLGLLRKTRVHPSLLLLSVSWGFSLAPSLRAGPPLSHPCGQPALLNPSPGTLIPAP